MRHTSTPLALLIAATFTLNAGAAEKYWLVVSAKTDAKVVITASVYGPGGSAFMAGKATVEQGQPAQLSTRRGDIEAVVQVTPKPDGGMTATLEVKDGGKLVQHSEHRVRMNTEAPSTDDGFHRVGGDIKAPQIISRVEPVYPPGVKRSKVNGVVVLECVIDDSGAVREAHILKSLTPALDKAAINAVSQWKFKPGTKDGQPVPVIFTLTVSFRIN
ncbi:MAG TPA: energy transducer TonB [Thermoanaerobaculia bacterium]